MLNILTMIVKIMIMIVTNCFTSVVSHTPPNPVTPHWWNFFFSPNSPSFCEVRSPHEFLSFFWKRWNVRLLSEIPRCKFAPINVQMAAYHRWQKSLKMQLSGWLWVNHSHSVQSVGFPRTLYARQPSGLGILFLSVKGASEAGVYLQTCTSSTGRRWDN